MPKNLPYSRHAVVRTSAAAVAAALLIATALPTAVDAAPAPLRSSNSAALALAVGDVGPQVRDVQQALIDAGAFLPGGVDGVFGSATAKAIADFQTWNGLIRTGSLNVATLKRLGLADGTSGTAAVAQSSASSSSSYGDLSPGSTGPAVTELQHALLDTGLVIRGGADGVYGAATQRAVRAFQSVNGLAQTGAMTDRAAQLLRLGSSSPGRTTSQSVAPASNGSGWTALERFPVQGHCAYGDTWHAARGGGRRHEGVDVIAATGNLLYAVADGTITHRFWDQPGRRAGNGLKLTAADGTYFVYLHMSAFAPGIAQGTRVQAGDVIGFVGNTGSSATPHLHFEIHPWGGAAINPYPYVRAIDDCSNTNARYQSSFS